DARCWFCAWAPSPTGRCLSMAVRLAHPQPPVNRLLAALSAEERDHLSPLLHTVTLKHKQAICAGGEAVGLVYFPVTAVLSLVSMRADGSSRGVGVIGNEGLAGLPALAGAGSAPFATWVEIPGVARRMRASVLGARARQPGPLGAALLRYTLALFDQL